MTVTASIDAALLRRIAALTFCTWLILGAMTLHAPRVEAADAVVSSIRAANSAGAIDGKTAASLQSTWRASARAERSLRRRGHAGRARELAAARSIALGMGKRRQLSAERLHGVLASVAATSYVMRKRSFPTYEERIRIPNDPLVYVYFSGRGVQFHPLATFAWGNTLYSTGQDDELRRLAERLLTIAVTRRGYRTWEYSFPYERARAPWVSGMAQAVGAQVLARAWKKTQDQRFLDAASAAVSGFTVPSSKGGVMTYEGAGRWYLLYGYNSRQRVLNGHLQALLGLNEYHKLTQDPRAQERVQEGLAAVLPMLGRFDTGAWSMYDLDHEANLNYHDLMITQLTRLGRRLPNQQLTDLGSRFSTYRNTPPTITLPEQRLRDIRPTRAVRRDRRVVRLRIDKRSLLVVQFVSERGRIVRTLYSSGRRGTHRIVWDGRSDRGRVVAPGSYGVRIQAKDPAGNGATAEQDHVVQVHAPKRQQWRRA